MVTYDLFLDESGKFDGTEHSVIGGFLIPNEDKFDEGKANSWRCDVIDQLNKEGLLSYDIVRFGNELHTLNIKNRRGKLSNNEEQKLIELTSKDNYIFDHCSENRHLNRDKIQTEALKLYSKKIGTLNGRIVVFYDSQGIYRIDNNTTYLTILSIGIVNLYNTLQKEHHGDVTINVHCAARYNITFFEESELYADTPLPGTNTYLDIHQYKAQLRNYAFLNGGHALMALTGFNNTLNSIEIMYDQDSYTANRITIIGDYISNSWFRRNKDAAYTHIFGNAPIFCVDVFRDRSFGLTYQNFNIDFMRQNHTWHSGLIDLISNDFPDNWVRSFFDAIPKRYDDQKRCVDATIDYIKPFIEERFMMNDWVERLETTLMKSLQFQKDVNAYFKANLLLFLDALYTHLGMTAKVKEVTDAFVRCVWNLFEIDKKNELILKYLNREIVTSSDTFRFQRAKELFNIGNSFFIKERENTLDLQLNLSIILGFEETPDNTLQTEYGKMIGSYMQSLSQRISISSQVDNELLSEAKDILAIAPKNFRANRDLIRCYQNMCDLFMAIRDFDSAISYLYISVRLKAGVPIDICKSSNLSTIEKAKLIIEHIGTFGRKWINNEYVYSTWDYYHFIWIVHRSNSYHSDIGGKLLELLSDGVSSISLEEWQHLIKDEHPYPPILWHLGASLSFSNKPSLANTAKTMLNHAYNLYKSKEMTMKAIAIAVRSEQIALMKSGIIPGNGPEICAKLNELSDTYQAFKESPTCIVDPFAGATFNQSMSCDTLLSVSRMISY